MTIDLAFAVSNSVGIVGFGMDKADSATTEGVAMHLEVDYSGVHF